MTSSSAPSCGLITDALGPFIPVAKKFVTEWVDFYWKEVVRNNIYLCYASPTLGKLDWKLPRSIPRYLV